MRFSASRLDTWMSCPLQAHFKYDQKLPDQNHAKTVFGRIIHACLEHYDRTRDIDEAKRLFRSWWADPEKLEKGLQIDYWSAPNRGMNFGGLRIKGIEILEAYAERFKFEKPGEILALEHRFLVPFGDHHELTGVVDKLEVRRSAKGKEVLRIVDHKTSSKKPTVAELALNPQGTIYILASLHSQFWTGVEGEPDFPEIANGAWLHETYKGMARRFIWHHLWTAQELDGGERNQAEFDRLYRACGEIERAIEYQVFVPNISAQSCGYCAYADNACPVHVPTEEEMREQESAWI